MARDSYGDLLAAKRMTHVGQGREISPGDVNEALFPFQRDLVRWAVRKGRAALFADTGLGKTPMQLEWAKLIGADRTLILAPLSVARQTVREGGKFGHDVRYVRHQSEVGKKGIFIANYEMVEQFDPATFGAVVLDESSILKALDGVTRRRLTEMFAATPYRLACTATPAPNDIAEIGTHAEFLGIMRHGEMLSAFFTTGQEQGGKQGYRLKGHARESFFQWLASWGMALRRPSDLGYEDDGFALPPLTVTPHFVRAGYVPDGQLFFSGLKGVTDRARVRAGTIDAKAEEVARLVDSNDGQWIVWHGLNNEGYELQKRIPGARLVEGNQTPEEKAAALEAFQDGEFQVLLTKPRIAGFGMNFQNAHQQAFCGLSDSWEAFYQAIRRSWRFGQTNPVEAHIVLAEEEAEVYENVMAKEREAAEMREELIATAREAELEELAGGTGHVEYATDERSGTGWRVMLGDSAERLNEIEPQSVGMALFSPPFSHLFVYSPSERDLGNNRGWDEFYDQFSYIIKGLLRVLQPGRMAVVHCQQLSTTVAHDGVTGIHDFRGGLIQSFIKEGFIFHGDVTIDKDPQAQAIRTKSKALLFVQKERDRSWLRPALADYLLLFRAPGVNATPIRDDQITNDEWIQWARPIWYGIRESETLNTAEGREDRDEKHIAALQLETVRRSIRLWSNPNDLVLDPFTGIGTTGYVAVENGRKFVGIELKRSYFDAATRNIPRATARAGMTLWDVVEEPVPA